MIGNELQTRNDAIGLRNIFCFYKQFGIFQVIFQYINKFFLHYSYLFFKKEILHKC